MGKVKMKLGVLIARLVKFLLFLPSILHSANIYWASPQVAGTLEMQCWACLGICTVIGEEDTNKYHWNSYATPTEISASEDYVVLWE